MYCIIVTYRNNRTSSINRCSKQCKFTDSSTVGDPFPIMFYCIVTTLGIWCVFKHESVCEITNVLNLLPCMCNAITSGFQTPKGVVHLC